MPFPGLKIESQTQLRDERFLPWYFHKDPYGAPFCVGGMCCNAYTHNRLCIQFIDLRTSISDKDVPRGGLDEWCDITSS